MHKTVCADGNNSKVMIELEFPNICPICNHMTQPSFLLAKLNDDDGNFVTGAFQCACGGVFLGFYEFSDDHYRYVNTIPANAKKTIFSDDICSLSHDFMEIYQQSEQAEKLGLNRICGVGYRKAVEFLIKDYCIFVDEKSKDAILEEKFIDSIKRLNNPQMKNLANKCRMLGNDETHTFIRYEEGIKELKLFIASLVNFIQIQFDAEKILQKN